MKLFPIRRCACGTARWVRVLGIGTRFFVYCPGCEFETKTYATRQAAAAAWEAGAWNETPSKLEKPG